MKEDETDGARSMDVDGETRKALCQHVECPNRIILHVASSGLSGCPLNLARVCHAHITYEVNQNCLFAFSHSSHSLTVRSSLYHISINFIKSGREVWSGKWIQSFRSMSHERSTASSKASFPHGASVSSFVSRILVFP